MILIVSLRKELRYAGRAARRVLGTLVRESPSIFETVKTPLALKWRSLPLGAGHNLLCACPCSEVIGRI